MEDVARLATRFEISRVLSVRTEQLERNAPAYVTDEFRATHPIYRVALEELEQGRLAFIRIVDTHGEQWQASGRHTMRKVIDG